MRSAFSAVAVASLATGAIAASVHGHMNAHEKLHAARDAGAEAQNYNNLNVDWNTVKYSFSKGQCWGPGNGCDSDSAPAATGAPAAPATYAPTSPTVAPVVAAAKAPSNNAPSNNAPSNNNPISQATSVMGSIASSLPTGGSTSSPGSGVNLGNILSSIQSKGMLSPTTSDSCAEGNEHPNQMDITNNAGKDMMWTCWGPAQSWVNTHAPIMAVHVAHGETKTVSFANTPSGQQGGACAPVFDGTQMVNGQLAETWLESTFNQYGTVDVSREVNMSGTPITALAASGCTTSMDQCVFKCNSGNSCGEAGSYHLASCSGQGANNGGVEGGCMFGNGKMQVTVG